MKFRIAKYEFPQFGGIRIKVPFCGLQNLLRYQEPIAFMTRREGWAADVYNVGINTVLATGYAPMGNLCPPNATLRAYDDCARAIQDAYGRWSNEAEWRTDELLKEFVELCQAKRKKGEWKYEVSV
jgi:hypothetical protein